MTAKEAKEILEKEGWTSFQKLYYRPMGIKSPEYEKVIVVQALEVCYDNHIFPLISPEKRDERYKKLKAAFEESHKDKEEGEPIKGEPVKGEHLNPALHDSAKDFNDSMLDEQAKKIKGLEAQNKKLNDIIVSRNNEIWELQEKVKKMAKMGKTIAHLNEVIGKKNAQIKDLKIDLEEKADLLECYRFSDKNKSDMISGLKKVNEKYRHQLADVTVAKIDEQALKSAESALVYKDGVIEQLKVGLENRRKKVEELSKKLKDSEKACKEYCDYGVGANNFIKKICSAYVNAHERGVYSLEALFAGKKYNSGLPLKDAFKYAEEGKKVGGKKFFTGVDLGSEEGDKMGYAIDVCEQQKKLAEYVGAFVIYNEIPIGKNPLTVDELIEIQKRLFRKTH